MCGRFTQFFTYADLHAYWRAFADPNVPAPLGNLQPRYHICPTDPIVAVLQTKAGLELARVRWGLAPFWWKEPLKKLPATFNARAETVATKPMFREAFKQRRCIIPASGYYEWQDRADGKQPWYFTAADGAPILLIAGLWETWKNPDAEGETVRSATMVITEPNKFTAALHDRMPVLLTKETMADWLTGAKGEDLLRPAPEHAVQAWPVSRKVNSSKAPDEPGLIEKVTL